MPSVDVRLVPHVQPREDNVVVEQVTFVQDAIPELLATGRVAHTREDRLIQELGKSGDDDEAG